MATVRRSPRGKLRGQKAILHSLDQVIQDTFRLWRKYHLGYDQTKYVVERVRRRLTLQPPRTRNRMVARLWQSVVAKQSPTPDLDHVQEPEQMRANDQDAVPDRSQGG
jgi:hypothetical protein